VNFITSCEYNVILNLFSCARWRDKKLLITFLTWWDSARSWWLAGFLLCFDAVGCVFSPVKMLSARQAHHVTHWPLRHHLVSEGLGWSSINGVLLAWHTTVVYRPLFKMWPRNMYYTCISHYLSIITLSVCKYLRRYLLPFVNWDCVFGLNCHGLSALLAAIAASVKAA